MASDSSRPGTTSITSAAGIRGVRAMASESWDDDFLWQHSSSSDLHLPSTASRHYQRHFQYRDKRLSTASSSSEYNSPRTQVPYHSQTRPHRKASSLSTSTMGSMTTQDESLPPLRTRLSRSTSSSQSQTGTQQQGKNWASLSTTSLQEEEDESTVTLATIATRQATMPSSISPRRLPTSPSPSKLRNPQQQNNTNTALLSSPSSFFRTTSSSSWRSTTPSLASDTCSAIQTSESGASATDTDNETIEEGDSQEDTTGNWEHLSLSLDAVVLASSNSGDNNAGGVRFGQGSNSRRKRGRGNTFSNATPRLALSSLFGTTSSTGSPNEQPDGTPSKPSKRLGASFFRRSSRLHNFESPSSGPKVVLSIEELQQHKSRSRSPTQLSGQQTPTLNHRERTTSQSKKEDKTVRARQSTNSSKTTSTSLVFTTNAGNEQSSLSPGRLAIMKQASFERTPKSSNATNGSSDYSHRQSIFSYDSSLSDRLRFDDAQLSASVGTLSPSLPSEHGDTSTNGSKSHGASSLVLLGSSLNPPVANQADKSSTSLISEHSSVTSTSAFDNASRSDLSRQSSMPRRKLKKIRPQTADATLARTSSFMASTFLSASPAADISIRSPIQLSNRDLSRSFAFPAPKPTFETFTPPRLTKSPAVSITAETGGSSNTSETASTSSMRNVDESNKKKKKSGIGSSLRRRVSKRKTEGVAEESSADESGHLNTRKGSLNKLVLPSTSPSGKTINHSMVNSSSSIETWKPTFSSTATLRDHHKPVQSGSSRQSDDKHPSMHASVISDSDLPPATGSVRGNHLLAGLSKRMSRDFKANKPSYGGPERKRSIIFARTEPQEVSLSGAGTTTIKDVEKRTSFIQAGPLPANNNLESANTIILKKHKRPLSLSGFLSKSTGPFVNGRSRSSTLTGDSASAHAQLARSTDETVLGRSIPSAPLSASAVGGFRRPSGFLHRSTASSGNIPTARALLENSALQNSTGSIDSRRPSSETFTRSPPVLQHRRSFNPLWRSATATVPEERPPSSLSLLSETSTVRPLSMLPTAVSTATITQASIEGRRDTASKLAESASTKLRQRHIPSLSLTLVPGAVTSTPPKPTSAGSSYPALSARTMQRAHSENPYPSSQSSSFRSQYFTASSTTGACSPKSKNASIPNTPSSSSRKSDDSDTSTNIVRRVSLSDLKIPQRITNTQAKIGEDLKRVKQFKEGVEELKRLRRVYRGLLTSDKLPSMLSFRPDSSISDSLDERAEASPSPPPIPTDATARVDNLMARVAVDYQKWWEIADVLINLADGADEAENEESQNKSPDRGRCKSDITLGSGSPPKASRELLSASRKESIVEITTTHMDQTLPGEPSIQREGDAGGGASSKVKQSTMPLSPTSHVLLSTPVQCRAPHLCRSYSTSSLSPSNSSPATPARTANHSISLSEHHNRDSSSNIEDHSASLSERQLHILRGMLNPLNSYNSSFTAPPIASHSRSAENSPAHTPSITSISPSSHLFTNGLVPLSPFTTRQSNTFPPLNRSPSSLFSSSTLVSPMRRKSSVKKGHVIITSVQTLKDDHDRLNTRSTSPRPDSPPFQISNMLPTPIFSPLSESAPFSPGISSRPTTSRSTSGQTTSSSTGNTTPSSLSTNKSPPTTPILMKGRLRQASRAGMLGIREFLKTFNNTRRNTAEDSNADTSLLIPEEGDGQIATARERSHLAEKQGENTDLSKIQTTTGLHIHEENMVKESPSSCSLRNVSNTTSPRSNASSEEEEDWDRRSSDEEEQGRVIMRSDTQATITPFSSLNDRLRIVEHGTLTGLGENKAGAEVHTGANGVVGEEYGSPLGLGIARGRTESATSRASTGTVIVHFSEQCKKDIVRPVNTKAVDNKPNRGRISPDARQKSTNRRSTDYSATISTNSSNTATSVTKFALTSEAMPALLAKVTEVKMHCAICVTELRNVTV